MTKPNKTILKIFGPPISDQTKLIPDPDQPEKSIYFKHWAYVAELAQVMYYQGLLDRQEWLQWVMDTVEKYKYPDDPVQRLVLPLVLQYLPEFVRYELLSRKLSLHCAKKITYLVNDTDAIAGGGDAQQPQHHHNHPVIQGGNSIGP